MTQHEITHLQHCLMVMSNTPNILTQQMSGTDIEWNVKTIFERWPSVHLYSFSLSVIKFIIIILVFKMSTFSHLGWDWMGDKCPPHPLILHQVHILHHTITPLIPRPSCRLSPPNSHLTQHSPHCPFHMFRPSRSSVPQLNKKVFNSTHLCHLTARPPVLPPHSCHVSQHPAITSDHSLHSVLLK